MSARVSLDVGPEKPDSREELDLLRREALKVLEKPLPRRVSADGGGGAVGDGTAPMDCAPRLG